MAPTAQNPSPSLGAKKKDMKKKGKEEEEVKSIPKKIKMGREIEEIFRDNKKKRKHFPGLGEDCSTKEKVGTEKEDKKANKKKNESHDKEKKAKGFPVDQTSENRSRRRTADGFALYTAEELGIGNPNAGSTPLCPFDCSCCF